MLTMILAVLTAALLAAVLYLLLERGRLCRVISERRRDIRMLRKLVRECEGKWKNKQRHLIMQGCAQRWVNVQSAQ